MTEFIFGWIIPLTRYSDGTIFALPDSLQFVIICPVSLVIQPNPNIATDAWWDCHHVSILFLCLWWYGSIDRDSVVLLRSLKLDSWSHVWTELMIRPQITSLQLSSADFWNERNSDHKIYVCKCHKSNSTFHNSHLVMIKCWKNFLVFW